jgi:hypothetical protein
MVVRAAKHGEVAALRLCDLIEISRRWLLTFFHQPLQYFSSKCLPQDHVHVYVATAPRSNLDKFQNVPLNFPRLGCEELVGTLQLSLFHFVSFKQANNALVDE